MEPEVLPPAPAGIAFASAAVANALAHRLPELDREDPLYETACAALHYMEQAKAKATRRAYASDWRDFAQWCDRNGLISLPATPSTVALYLTSLAKPGKNAKPRKAGTMNHRLVADILHGIRRTLGVAQIRKKPLTRDRLLKLIGSLEGPIAAACDKALLLIGLAGSLRRSEFATIRVKDLVWHKRGVTILIPRSKTDQEGQGREVEIPYGTHDLSCPIMALENWLKIASIKEGQLFRRVDRAHH